MVALLGWNQPVVDLLGCIGNGLGACSPSFPQISKMQTGAVEQDALFLVEELSALALDECVLLTQLFGVVLHFIFHTIAF